MRHLAAEVLQGRGQFIVLAALDDGQQGREQVLQPAVVGGEPLVLGAQARDIGFQRDLVVGQTGRGGFDFLAGLAEAGQVGRQGGLFGGQGLSARLGAGQRLGQRRHFAVQGRDPGRGFVEFLPLAVQPLLDGADQVDQALALVAALVFGLAEPVLGCLDARAQIVQIAHFRFLPRHGRTTVP